MEYREFIQGVLDLGFIRDSIKADSAVKAVLNILASKLDEAGARRLSEKLPGPLSLERMRSQQARPLTPSVEGYVGNIATQFHLSADQTHQLIDRVLHLARESAGEDAWKDVQEHLPPEWAKVVQQV